MKLPILALAALAVSSSVLADDFQYEDLVSLIQKKSIRTMEDLLPLLPTDLRSNYTLMYESRSLQDATPTSPRVILFGKNAKLTCAFNGEPTQAGYDSLECFQFRDETQSFDFRQIQFPTAENGLKTVAFSRSGTSVDEKTSCMGCHGSPQFGLRPNWDSYSTWKGAYGENDDNIGDQKTAYAGFVARRDSHPRYRYLIQDATFPTAPYEAPTSSVMDGRPNLRFSDYVGRWNAIRAGRILRNSVANWERLAFAVKGLRCEFNPAETDRLDKSGRPYLTDFNLDNIFKKIGIPSRVWTTRFKAIPNETYDFQSGFGFLAIDTGMAIVADLAAQGDSDFKAALENVTAAVNRAHTGAAYGPFFETLNSILPDPDRFGNYDENAALFCPRLKQIAIDTYLRTDP